MRDNTEDWVIPRGSVPTLSQLEARIDEALVIARVSEDGVREVGEMTLDAARQARRAAEAAEASARAAAEAVVQAAPQVPVSRDDAVGPAGPVTDLVPPPPATGGGRSPKSVPPPGRDVEAGAQAETASQAASVSQPRFEVRFRSFNERADRLSARLRALEDHPSHRPGSSVGAGRRRGDG